MKVERPEPKSVMPPDAKLVFKGKIFDVYQWEQEMYDGSKVIFERLKRPDTTVVVAVTENKKIALTFQEQPSKKPFLGLAGGRLEEGEDPELGARRELLEETGYEAKEMKLWHAIQPTSKVDWAIYTFVATDCKKVAEQNLDGGEKIEVRLLDFEEFMKAVTEDMDFLETETLIEVLRAQADPERMKKLKEFFGIS